MVVVIHHESLVVISAHDALCLAFLFLTLCYYVIYTDLVLITYSYNTHTISYIVLVFQKLHMLVLPLSPFSGKTHKETCFMIGQTDAKNTSF